jgi:sugar/nucleoside kinase (ribokinase family)
MSVPALLVVGELCADIVVELDAPPVFGQAETLVRRTTVVLGSSSAITACGTARLGVPTSMVGVVGNDLLGTFVTSELRRRGVDITGCVVDGTIPTGSSTILTLPSGDRSILTATGSIGAVATRHVADEIVDASAHVHVGAYFLQRGLQPGLATWFADLRARGRTTSLDPNYDPAQTWDSGIGEMLAAVDVFFCNEQEAMAVAGASTPGPAVAWLLERMPPEATVVLKLGAGGAAVHYCDSSGPRQERVAVPDLPGAVVDTVGAGDSLAAGYLAARLRSLDRTAALAVGVANGTASTRAPGGIDGQLDWAGITPRRDV